MSFGIIPSVLLAAFILAPTAFSALLPVSEDSYSFGSNKMDRTSGKAPVLAVSPDGMAFVRFDAGDFAGQIPAGDVTAARLTFHINEKLKAGGLSIHKVNSEWTESPSGTRIPPSIDPKPLATLPADSLREGQFAVVDITGLVRQWVESPATDFGIAIVGKGKATLIISSKEGPEEGHPATLEIDHHPLVDNSRITAGMDAAKLGNGSVNNAEFGYLNGLLSPAQGQFDSLGNGLGNLTTSVDSMTKDLTGVKNDLGTLGNDLANLTTSSAGKVNRSGDTMTGSLILPENGLKVGARQLAITDGKVGIGTDTPSAALEVRGDVKLGNAGDLQAAAGEESLRIVRGVLENQNGNVVLISGQGFSFAKPPLSTNELEITFSHAFSSTPSVSIEEEVTPTSINSVLSNPLRTASASGFLLRYLADSRYSGIRIHFIAIGPR